MDKPKSHTKAILALLAIVAALNLAVIIALMSVALSKTPLETAKTDNAGLFMAAAKFQGLPARIKGAKPGDVDVLKLSEEDVNCLLAAALGKNGIQMAGAGKMPVKSLSVKIKDTVTQVDFTKEIGFWTPFGRYLNAHAKLHVEIDESKGTDAQLLKLKVGKMNVPPWLVQWWLNRKIGIMDDDTSSEDFRRIVVSLKMPPSLLILKYHPYELRMLIESKLNSPLLKNFWDML